MNDLNLPVTGYVVLNTDGTWQTFDNAFDAWLQGMAEGMVTTRRRMRGTAVQRDPWIVPVVDTTGWLVEDEPEGNGDPRLPESPLGM
jgi:hypothetical protein